MLCLCHHHADGCHQLSHGHKQGCHKYELGNGFIELRPPFSQEICMDSKGEDTTNRENYGENEAQ